MASLSSLKPFLPLLFTFVLPRAISYYRTVKTAVRTRPPRRPLTEQASRGLNILFAGTCFFLFLTLPLSRSPASQNIFSLTNSRLHIPTDVLFSRLALIRANGVLSSFDEALKEKISTPITRQLYMRFGPDTLVNCAFCQPEDDISYLLHYLPSNVILPHLLHFVILGLSTSESVAGFEASLWRTKCSIGALALVVLDLYTVITFNPKVEVNMPAPQGLYWRAKILRPLILCLFDVFVAFFVYASTTNRFLLFTSSVDGDPEVVGRQQEQMLNQANISLQMIQTKLRAISIVRNAVVREPSLKSTDDEYWRAVAGMEGPSGVEGLWEEEEVQAAIASSLGRGNLDVARMGKEADAFVDSITKGLNENADNTSE